MSRILLRLLGLVLLLAVVLPLYPLARPGAPGSPGEHLRSLAASYHEAFLLGLASVAVLAVLLGLTSLPRRAGAFCEGPVRSILLAPSSSRFALGVGLLGGLASLLLSAFLFAFHPALVDASSQLVHARYLASGRLAGPELPLPEFFTFQYMVNLPTGWASQYPPGHILLLALGFALGIPWLVGPLLAGLTAGLTARIGEELLPDDPVAARLGALLLALSLFFLGHAATYMNHVTAAAFGGLALLGVLRGRGGAPQAGAWLPVAGLAVGIVLATRPLAGVVVGTVALAVLVLPRWAEGGTGRRLRPLLREGLLLGAGFLPPALALAAYNQRLFGGPTRFGYLVAEGPGHGPGFHEDPWGNLYTPLEGLAQASTDLLALGLDLLMTPVSAVLVVGAYLLLGPRRPSPGFLVLLLWAVLPVAAHVFYWHHDLVMGPRLLTEFAPAWTLLTARATLGLVRRARTRRRPFLRRLDPYGLAVGICLISVVAAAVLLVPNRLAVYHLQWGGHARPPAPELQEPALVFVHGGWEGRLGARLAAHGLRADSVRLALQHNTSCEVQEFLDRRQLRSTGEAGIPSTEPSPVPSPPEGLHFGPRPEIEIVRIQVAPGVAVRTSPQEEPAPECVREANADRHGILPLPDLLWRGDLPGLAPRGALFARDLGPELNHRLLESFPNREPRIYLRPDPRGAPLLRPYAEGMSVLWGESGASEGEDPEP